MALTLWLGQAWQAEVVVHTAGSPRVGNAAFAAFFNRVSSDIAVSVTVPCHMTNEEVQNVLIVRFNILSTSNYGHN